MTAEQATQFSQQSESLVASMLSDRAAAPVSAPAAEPAPPVSVATQVPTDTAAPSTETAPAEAPPPEAVKEEPRLARLVEANARKDREIRQIRQSTETEVERRVQERLAALRGDDPDSELKKLGLSDDDRKAMYRRGWFKHTPEGAPAEVRQELGEQRLVSQIKDLSAQIEQLKQDGARKTNEAEASSMVAQHLGGPETDSTPYLKREYVTDPKAATAAFFAVGREMVQAGQLDPQNQPPEDVVRRIGRELDRRIRTHVERTTKVHQPNQHQSPIQTPPNNQTAAPQTQAPTQTITNKATSTTQPKRQPQTTDEMVAAMIADRPR